VKHLTQEERDVMRSLVQPYQDPFRKMGLSWYYRQIIPKHAETWQPLTTLTKKEKKLSLQTSKRRPSRN
jgi:hypothetical protein